MNAMSSSDSYFLRRDVTKDSFYVRFSSVPLHSLDEATVTNNLFKIVSK